MASSLRRSSRLAAVADSRLTAKIPESRLTAKFPDSIICGRDTVEGKEYIHLSLKDEACNYSSDGTLITKYKNPIMSKNYSVVLQMVANHYKIRKFKYMRREELIDAIMAASA
jgi:hypothetical protein